MNNNFNHCLDLVLVHEGGFVHHKLDPGGATNRGVTQAVYDAYRKTRGRGAQSVKFISDDEVKAIMCYVLSGRQAPLPQCLPVGQGYALYVRGIRSAGGGHQPASSPACASADMPPACNLRFFIALRIVNPKLTSAIIPTIP